mgnify:CR=1 FL=1
MGLRAVVRGRLFHTVAGLDTTAPGSGDTCPSLALADPRYHRFATSDRGVSVDPLSLEDGRDYGDGEAARSWLWTRQPSGGYSPVSRPYSSSQTDSESARQSARLSLALGSSLNLRWAARSASGST